MLVDQMVLLALVGQVIATGEEAMMVKVVFVTLAEMFILETRRYDSYSIVGYHYRYL